MLVTSRAKYPGKYKLLAWRFGHCIFEYIFSHAATTDERFTPFYACFRWVLRAPGIQHLNGDAELLSPVIPSPWKRKRREGAPLPNLLPLFKSLVWEFGGHK